MLHTNSVNSFEIKNEKRFNPTYFKFLNTRKELINNKLLNFLPLGGNDKLTSLITDGEHAAISIHEEGEKNADIQYLNVHSVKFGIIDKTDSKYISKKDHDRLQRSKLVKNDVILTIVGSIGNSALVDDYLPETNIPRNIAKIVVNESKLKPEFLVCFFLSKFGKEQSYYSSGGNLQGLLSLTKIRGMYVPVPPFTIQNKYVKLYRSVLDKEKQSLILIESAKKYVYKKLGINFKKFSKRNYFSTTENNLKQSDFWTCMFRYPMYLKIENELEKKFKMIELEEKFFIDDGDEVGSENYFNIFDRGSDFIPFVRTSDFINYETDQLNTQHALPPELKISFKQDLKEGDLLFSNDGKIGNVSIITDSNVIIQSHINRLRSKNENDFDTYYLFILLLLKEIGQFQCKRLTWIQSTIPTIGNKMGKIRIPILEKSDRQHISTLVKKAFKLKKEKNQLLKKIKNTIDNELQYF
tara:strand:+ start:2081 stop:3484 length:1404 start_codon:yes stop_codon:yes gene_type:complete